MLWVLIAVYKLCNVLMIRDEVQNLHLPLYILNIFLQGSASTLTFAGLRKSLHAP